MTTVKLKFVDSDNESLNIKFYTYTQGQIARHEANDGTIELGFVDELSLIGLPAFVESGGSVLAIDAPTTILVNRDSELQIRYRKDSHLEKLVTETVVKVTQTKLKEIEERIKEIEQAGLGNRLAAIESLKLDERLSALENQKCDQRLTAIEDLKLEQSLKALSDANKELVDRVKKLDETQSTLKELLDTFGSSNIIELINR